MPLSHIVVPVDYSEKSECAARYALALNQRFQSRLTLVHVLPPPHYEFGAMEVGGSILEDLFRNRAEQARKDLDDFLAAELPAEIAERLLIEGDPAAKIVKVAHERGAGLIVMPTHGYGTFRRFILGSVTAKVLHDADCPVWTGVHLEAQNVEEVRLKRVAVAVDLGPQTERTLMWAQRFAESAGAELMLVHAMPNLEGHSGEYFDPDWRRHMEASVSEEIRALTARLGFEAPLLADSGEAAETVCALVQEWGADLLVIGRGSAAGVFGRLRANAYSIIRQSHCPVVSV
ncbi:MAG: universal stress protein [Acidobacteria bacterium]|nr:universal stress protein [Acidobacteriota bacterium]